MKESEAERKLREKYEAIRKQKVAYYPAMWAYRLQQSTRVPAADGRHTRLPERLTQACCRLKARARLVLWRL